ncbi:MAG: DUF1559 domain-containing protein [Phycisphaeraceae bacterium]|nr:DUF1559 domain-containing protein [Phycisphaeraceae bacterium]
MPSLAMVRETARRVVCSSNVRQHGLGVAMYVEDYHDQFPPSVFSAQYRDAGSPEQMDTLRLEAPADAWDGLGHLYAGQYLDAPGVFYCPSHRGEHSLARYSRRWNGLEDGQIIGNYHYRSSTSDGRRFTLFSQPTLAVVSDSMRTYADFSHRVGTNVMRVDMSVAWFADSASRFIAMLPTNDVDPRAQEKIEGAWNMLDGPATSSASR